MIFPKISGYPAQNPLDDPKGNTVIHRIAGIGKVGASGFTSHSSSLVWL